MHIAWRTDGRYALDGDDALVNRTCREHEATADQLAVDEHTARAALTLLARTFAAEQPETFAKHVEQALAEPRIANGSCLAVDMKFVLLVESYRLTHWETPFEAIVMQARQWRDVDTRR